jgi:replicative DNA helicase
MNQTTQIEEQLLSTILIEPACLYSLDLEPEMFGSSMTRDIYTAIREVVEQDKDLDPVIVAEFLAKRDDSKNWLLTLMEMNERSVAIPKNIESYANIIKQQHQHRRDLQAAQRFLNEVKEGEEGALNNLLSIMLRSDGSHEAHISDSLNAVVEHVDQLQQGLVEPGVKSGICQLDNVTGGFQAGDLIVLAARTSVGKTAVMCNFAVNGNCSTGIISAEQSAQQLAQRMVSIVADVTAGHMRTGYLTGEETTNMISGATKLTDRDIWIYDKALPSIEEVCQIANQWKWQHDIKILYVDYLQYIQSNNGDAKYQRIADVTAKLKALAKRLNIPVVALAQVNRNVEQRNEKRPGLSDLRDSGDIEQDADQVIFAYRDAMYVKNIADNEIELILDKNRHGPRTIARAVWIPERMKIGNPAR